MNVLITGVAGFFGSRLAKWILAQQPAVAIVGLDNMSGGISKNVPKGIEFHELSCGNCECLFEKHDFDYVFHFAAYAAEGLSPFIRKYNYQNNIIETANLINLCIKYSVKRLVFTSSVAVYGKALSPLREVTVPSPMDPYGIAKYACEMDLKVAHEQHGLDYCILRPHNVFGANQNLWDVFRNVIGIWMRQHLAGEPLLIFGDGTQVRQFTEVENCLPAIWHAATLPEASGRIFNLGSDRGLSINEASELVSGVMGGAERKYAQARHEAHTLNCCHKLAREVLGYEESVSFEAGVARMWEWAQQQPPRPVRNDLVLEIDKGLYPAWQGSI